ncbi:hypothetical protein SAMN05216188_101543 [Lentzea xinjiangensis]|uniref:Uncharacterized protein n=1 Tax=Lentzea xinjiangensis TaxID=402600 RepID=A0A1H9AUX3_9PSEU|nr:hypothetical protein [Lentzea xinjiangensis]SEP80540.1 hypothetical protein SAMN05216188_101543 [Lentzea xinjiangensis]
MGVERIGEIVREHYLTAVARSYGSKGTDTVRTLVPTLKEIFAVLDYESINGSLTVFQTVDPTQRPVAESEAYTLTGAEDIPVHNLGTLTIQILGNGQLLLWKKDVPPLEVSDGAIVYRFEPDKGERMWIDGEERAADLPGYVHLFGIPTFLDLADALQHYSVHIARPSECPYLTSAWREDGRVMWKAKPEELMRLSLYQFLRSALRTGRPDIHQEAPTDANNPVDITVRWADSNRIAIIEVKWLGKSGVLDPPAFRKAYSESRAQDGLRQLASYLDLTKSRAPRYDQRGYLAVFDGRRARVKVEDTQCTRENGMAYVDAHISYDQDLLDRHDVATPVRFFCEPRWVLKSPSKGG